MSHSLVQVAHSVEGRIRLKVKHGKGAPEVLNAVAEKFRGLPGVERIDTNPVTGTVVLIYDPDRHGEFMGHVERSVGRPLPAEPPKTDIDKRADAISSEGEYLSQHSHTARAFFEAVKRADEKIKVATRNNVDLKIVLAGGVIAATIIEIGAAAATPVWVTLLLFGTNHYVELHGKAQNGAEIRAKRPGNGVGQPDAETRAARPGNGADRPDAIPHAAQRGNGADDVGAGI